MVTIAYRCETRDYALCNVIFIWRICFNLQRTSVFSKLLIFNRHLNSVLVFVHFYCPLNTDGVQRACIHERLHAAWGRVQCSYIFRFRKVDERRWENCSKFRRTQMQSFLWWLHRVQWHAYLINLVLIDKSLFSGCTRCICFHKLLQLLVSCRCGTPAAIM